MQGAVCVQACVPACVDQYSEGPSCSANCDSLQSATCWRSINQIFMTGEINLPYAWQPTIVEIQILRAGQLIILSVPGEFTTMAGRRLRTAVHDAVRALVAP